MYLRFETKASDAKKVGIPTLVDVEAITPDSETALGVKIDDAEVGVSDEVLAVFQMTVGRFNTETLPPEHFRDCAHFAMAMCGLWMPTHPVFDRSHDMVTACDDQTAAKEHLGPTSLGIPNDARCLGFGPIPFVYSHAVFGVESSIGTVCFSKLGVNPEYSLSTFDVALAETDNEVSHLIRSLGVVSAGQEVFKWIRES